MFAVDLEDGSTTPSGEATDSAGDSSQLPDVEEYKAQHGVVGRSQNGMRAGYKWCLIVSVTLVFAAICAGIALIVSDDDKNQQPSYNDQNSNGIPFDGFGGDSVDDEEPSPSDRSRVSDVSEFVIQMQWSSREDIELPGTPQWEAVQWIADYDRVQLPIDDSLEFKQRYVLTVLYFALDGANWAYHLNFLSRENVCDWFEVWPSEDNPNSEVGIQVGVSCFDDFAISDIFLPALDLKGEMPQEIGLLTALTDITLYGNEISGSLPDSMKLLTNLQRLTLHDNKLEGVIPDIFRDMNLHYLNLANNNITGELPNSLEDMTSLITLNLAKNDIEAEIGSFALLGNLQNLFLEGNMIHGGLGNWILTQWPKLIVLDVSDNFIMSAVPDAIFRHPSLLIVDLHANKFTGPLVIPDGSQASDIIFLSLQENELNGAIPDAIGLLTKLEHLDLANNLFTDLIPEEIFGLSNLKYLFLAYNNFEPGDIPPSIVNMTSLVDLSLKETNRIGPIPDSIGALVELVLLDLDGNSLNGYIPASIGNLDKLSFLFLSENKLEGQVPQTFSNLQNMRTLLLNNNTLTGPTAAVCAPTLPYLSVFIGDCKDPTLTGSPLLDEFFELDCPCCTKCCSENLPSCNTDEWYSELDPIWEYKYARRAYAFNEETVVYPATPRVPSDGEDVTDYDMAEVVDYIMPPDLSSLYAPDVLYDVDPYADANGVPTYDNP